MKSYIAKIYANIVARRIYSDSDNAVAIQESVMKNLIYKASETAFGKDHFFNSVSSYDDFKKNIPIQEYEGLKPYIERTKAGESNVLWPDKPLYFAKTSGTTSGSKFIPISKESIKCHISAAKNTLLLYIYNTGNADFLKGKMIFLQGSPILEDINGVKTGRLSGIAAHYVPAYLTRNRMPSWETNCIDNWEDKVDTIVLETINSNMTLVSGIPSWVSMYFEKLTAKSNKTIAELFPNFELFVYGGVDYEPYRDKFEKMIGKSVNSVEVYPASEGFIANQDIQNEKGLLLLVNNGIFYEFIPANEYFNENPTRLSLGQVTIGVNYAIILSTNAGLWGYSIGDTVSFVSLSPPRIIVTGRIKHFISAFGEHVIGKEVEKALQEAILKINKNCENDMLVRVNEFTVAPQISPKEGLPFHEWFIDFDKKPLTLKDLENKIDLEMRKQNRYYNDLIEGKILQQLKISPVSNEAFKDYMKSIGRFGGQNKVTRLSNDRKIASFLETKKE